MKINIYTPTYHRIEKTKRSLNSIISSLSLSSHDVVLYIGDNNSPQEMKEWLRSLASNKVSIYFSEKNVGKAAIINHLHSIARKCDYVVSIDSDMVVPEEQQKKWLDTMVDALNKTAVGMIATHQLEGCCHVMNTMTERSISGYKLLLSNGGIAGGCIMMPTPYFDAIKGYHVLDVYNGDDALIMRKTREMLRKNVAILPEVALIHPHEDNKAYQQWKLSKAYGKLPNGPNTKGFFDA